MKRLLKRDLSPRATLAILALALVATLVTGRETVPTPAAPVADTSGAVALAADDQRDVEIVARQPNDMADRDLFPAGAATPPPAPPAAPKVVPPEPSPVVERPAAPPLPFKYLGQLEARKRSLVLLAKGDEVFMVGPGDTVDDDYRLDSIAESSVQLVYLPLGLKQSLPIPTVP